jgi:hypothetical protein
VPIYIQANWRSQGQNILGSAGPARYYTDFKNIPHENRYYPSVVAEKITGKEITGSTSPDIVATFNKDMDWYFETDGETPTQQYDFVTVVLHEITHGLGFTGFFDLKLNKGTRSILDNCFLSFENRCVYTKNIAKFEHFKPRNLI